MCLLPLPLNANCQEVKPISRKEFFTSAALDYTNVKISYDGKWLAYIGMYNGHQNIFIYDLQNRISRPLTKDTGRGITKFSLAYDNKTILYQQDTGGDENFNLYGTNVETGETKTISKIPGVRNVILATSIKRPNEIIVGNNKRDPAYTDAYIIDLRTGDQKLLFENNYYVSLWFDDNLRLRLGANQTNSASVKYFYYKDNGDIELLRHVSTFDQYQTMPISIGPKGWIYWLDSENVDKAGLTSLNPITKEKQIHYIARKADVTDKVFFHHTNGRPLWLYEDYAKPELMLLDLSYSEDFRKFPNFTTTRSYIEIQTSLDEDMWLLEQISDDKPSMYYIYDRKKPNISFLFSAKESLSKYNFSKTYAYDVRTSDGLVEMCYLNIPPQFDNGGKSTKPLPTILTVHGGPNARDFWHFDLSVATQLFASRGFLVIRCNYRASLGYGKVFTAAGNGEWGRRMQEDLTDAVKWSIAMNFSDPNKVVIAGASYGGYATLAGVTFTPDLYKCGVAIAAPSNLITDVQNMPTYWKPNMPVLNLKLCNDQSCSKDYLQSRSPLFLANRIKVPLLIIQGELDPRVNKVEAEQIVNAMKNSSIPLIYVRFPDEGHWNFRPPNLMATIAIIDDFLEKCLGGYSDPITDEVGQSTAIIETYNNISVGAGTWNW